jgi:tetratricopeptide (TPR) repeat protein
MGLLDRLLRRNSAAPAQVDWADHSFEQWRQPFQSACELMHSLEFEQALTQLTLADKWLPGASKTGAGFLRSMMVRRMGTCHLESGRAEISLPLFREAIELCREARDEDGLISSLSSLYEAHRCLGQAAAAADGALECASALECATLDRADRMARARRFRKVAEIVRRGEPPNRVVLEIGDDFFELDEIPPVIKSSVHFIFHRDRMFLARAIALMKRGGKMAMRGSFEEALPLLREACRIDPHAPGPLYVQAATLMRLERVSEALACYNQLEVLAPGWHNCRAERWLAAGIAAGRIPHSVFSQISTLEDWSVSAAEQVRLACQGLSETPAVPAFHLYLGIYLSFLGQKYEARKAIAEGLERAEEPDLRSRLLVQFAELNPCSPERNQRLHEAMAPGGNLAAAAMAAVMLYSRKAE